MSPFRRPGFALGLILLYLLAGLPARAETRKVHVTLALICDIYEMTEKKGRGGYARIAGAISAERARAKNIIVAHAGDAISPSLFSGFDRGEHAIDLTNRLGIDVFIPGNHEFDFGEKIYRQRMSEAKFAVLAANLRDRDGMILPGHADVKHFTFEGVKIAVIGLTADDSPKKSSPGSLRFQASVPLAKKLAAKLRATGADIVVAVAHAGRRQDIRLFNSGVLDVLLSGDDHDLAVLYDGDTAMIEAMSEGEVVAAIDLEISVHEGHGKRKVRWHPRFRIIDTADVQPDQAVAAQVVEYQNILSKELDVPLGKTAVDLDSRENWVRMKESPIGNMIADAMRERLGADVAIMNGGGIRGARLYPAGSEITRRDIMVEMPFGNKLYMVELSGVDLIKVFENGVWYAGKTNGRFAHLSGVSLQARAGAVPGRRIQSVKIGGKPLDLNRIYKVAANDFIASGKEGYDVFASAKRLVGETDAPLVSNVVMSYIRAKGTIAPKVEGRVVLE